MIATPVAPIASSFRDPAGSVLRSGGRILRTVHAESVAKLEAFLMTRTARQAVEAGRLVSSERLSTGAFPGLNAGEAVYEHERVPFPSYPYEWPAEMLHTAGILTLDLALAALDEGFGIKDAR